MFTSVLKFIQRLKEWKEKYGENKEVGNIEKMIFVIFEIYLKQSKNVRKPMSTSY